MQSCVQWHTSHHNQECELLSTYAIVWIWCIPSCSPIMRRFSVHFHSIAGYGNECHKYKKNGQGQTKSNPSAKNYQYSNKHMVGTAVMYVQYVTWYSKLWICLSPVVVCDFWQEIMQQWSTDMKKISKLQ